MPPRVMQERRPLAVLAAVLMAAAFVFFVPASEAAQDPGDCYPDGCGTTTTTEPPASGPTCGISLEAGVVSAEVIATVHNVPLGAEVRILVHGNEVARGVNEGGVQPIRSMPMQGAGDVVMTFDIPDLAPGDYSIVAVGVGFTVTCSDGGLEVLASSGDGGGGKGPLAFTGAEIIGFVALGLALLILGWYMVRRSRRRTA